MGYLDVGSRTALIVVFAVAAVSKLRGRAAWNRFRVAVAALAPVPPGLVTAVAVVAVTGEVVVVPALVGRPTVVPGSALAAGLLLAFALTAVRAWQRGQRVRCACFGTGTELGLRHAVRNLVLAATAALGLLAAVRLPASGAVLPAGSHPVGAAVAAATGALAGLLVIWLDDLIELFAGRPVGLARTE